MKKQFPIKCDYSSSQGYFMECLRCGEKFKIDGRKVHNKRYQYRMINGHFLSKHNQEIYDLRIYRIN